MSAEPVVRGRIMTYEGARLPEEVEMVWTDASTEWVAAEVRTTHKGAYEISEGLEVGHVYVVTVAGAVGIPSTVLVDGEELAQDFYAYPARGTANVSGHIDAYNGDKLPGTQKFRIYCVTYDTWATAETATVDCTCHSPAGQKWAASMPGGETYQMWVNRGPARHDSPYTDQFSPPDGASTSDFRRESGTVAGYITNGGAETMQWWRGGVPVTYAWTTNANGYYGLVSLPCNLAYAIRINGQAAATGSPYTMPCRSGTGNDTRDFTKQ